MIVMSALLLVLLLAPLGVAPNPTLTASMHRTLYSGVEFSRTQMYPPSTLIIYTYMGLSASKKNAIMLNAIML